MRETARERQIERQRERQTDGETDRQRQYFYSLNIITLKRIEHSSSMVVCNLFVSYSPPLSFSSHQDEQVSLRWRLLAVKDGRL